MGFVVSRFFVRDACLRLTSCLLKSRRRHLSRTLPPATKNTATDSYTYNDNTRINSDNDNIVMGLIGFLRKKKRTPSKTSGKPAKKGAAQQQQGGDPTKKPEGPTIIPEPDTTTEHVEGTNSTELESSHDAEAVVTVTEVPIAAAPPTNKENESSTAKEDDNDDDDDDSDHEESEESSDSEGMEDPSFEIVESPKAEVQPPLKPIETNESKEESEKVETSVLEKFKAKSPPRRGNKVAERAAWLQKSAFKEDGPKTPESSASPASREKAKAKKLFWEGKTFQKETSNAPDPPSMRNKTDVLAKKKWLETVAFTPSGGGNMKVEECTPEKRKHTMGLMPSSPVHSGSPDEEERPKTRTARDLLKALDSYDRQQLHTEIYLDKEDDPYEWAYENWFHEGLLPWRPSSFAEGDVTIYQSMREILDSPSKSRTGVEDSPDKSPRKLDLESPATSPASKSVKELRQSFMERTKAGVSALTDSKDTGEMATSSTMDGVSGNDQSALADVPAIAQSESLVSQVSETQTEPTAFEVAKEAEPSSKNQTPDESDAQTVESSTDEAPGLEGRLEPNSADECSNKAMVDLPTKPSTSLETTTLPDEALKSVDSPTVSVSRGEETEEPTSPSTNRKLSWDCVVYSAVDDVPPAASDSPAAPSHDPNFAAYSAWHEQGLIEWNPSDGIPPPRSGKLADSTPSPVATAVDDPTSPGTESASAALADTPTDPGHDLSDGFGDPRPPALPIGPEPNLVGSDVSVQSDDSRRSSPVPDRETSTKSYASSSSGMDESNSGTYENGEPESFGESWDDDEELQELFELQQNILQKFRQEADDLLISDGEVDAEYKPSPSEKLDGVTEAQRCAEDDKDDMGYASESTDASKQMQQFGKQYFGSDYTNDSMEFLSVDGESGVQLEPSVMTHASSITHEEVSGGDILLFADSFDGQTEDSSKEAAASFELMDELRFLNEMSASSKSRGHAFGESQTENRDHAPAQPSRRISTEGNGFGNQQSAREMGGRRPSADHAPSQPSRKVSVEDLELFPLVRTKDHNDWARSEFEMTSRSTDHAPAQPMRKISVEGQELVPAQGPNVMSSLSKQDTAPISPVRVASTDDFGPQNSSDSLRKARARKIATAIRGQYVMWLTRSRTTAFRKSTEAPILSVFSKVVSDISTEAVSQEGSVSFVLPFLSVPPRLQGKFRPRLQRETPTSLPVHDSLMGETSLRGLDDEREASLVNLRQELREYISPSRRKSVSDALQRFETAKQQKTVYMRRAFTNRK